jgi:hypothetical protein
LRSWPPERSSRSCEPGNPSQVVKVSATAL